MYSHDTCDFRDVPALLLTAPPLPHPPSSLFAGGNHIAQNAAFAVAVVGGENGKDELRNFTVALTPQSVSVDGSVKSLSSPPLGHSHPLASHTHTLAMPDIAADIGENSDDEEGEEEADTEEARETERLRLRAAEQEEVYRAYLAKQPASSPAVSCGVAG